MGCVVIPGGYLSPGDDRGWPPFDISNVGQFTISIKLYDPPLRMHTREEKLKGERWFWVRFPEFFPLPRFPGTISPDFGSVSDVIIGRSGTSEAHHVLYACHVISRQVDYCWSSVDDSLKTHKDKLNMAIVVSGVWFSQDFFAKII